MENNDKLIKDAIEKLCNNNVIPQERLKTIMNDVEDLKKRLVSLSQQELNSLLKSIPEQEINKIKDQITQQSEQNYEQ